jgi:hypothetical protein
MSMRIALPPLGVVFIIHAIPPEDELTVRIGIELSETRPRDVPNNFLTIGWYDSLKKEIEWYYF